MLEKPRRKGWSSTFDDFGGSKAVWKLFSRFR